MKKIMLLALAAIGAMLVVPTFASATPAHVNTAGSFTAHGGASELSRTSGSGIHGTTATGTGSFENTTTGTIKITLHGVTSSVGNCTSTGQPSGTVTFTKLPFHLVTIRPFILMLITIPAGHLASPVCGGFVPFSISGNGILGTITSPACGGTSNKATLKFESASAGHQKHTTWTGTTYGLSSSLAGSVSPTSLNAAATITFPANRTLTCT
jgi:hypothetical protein